MAISKFQYSAATQITITLNGLGSASARQSTVVDNTSNLYLDALLGGSFKTAAGSLGTPPYLNIYIYALTDGTNYSGGATGSDAAYTMTTYRNLALLGTVFINTAGTTEYMAPRSVAQCFGGVLPSKWGIVVENVTGLALDSSTAGTVYYTGINTQF